MTGEKEEEEGETKSRFVETRAKYRPKSVNNRCGQTYAISLCVPVCRV